MLPRNYRFAVQNVTGQTIAASGVIVHMRRWKRASDGSITFEATEATVLDNPSVLAAATIEEPSLLPAPMLATGGYFDGTAQDNSSDKWEGATVEFVVTAPSLANGPVILLFKRSTDGGTVFDDDSQALEMERIQFITAATKRLSFQI